MTITKEVIPTKANVSETDLSKFLVVHPGEFIYNPRTHGKRIGFGYNNTNDNFIISWNNIAFKVKPSMKRLFWQIIYFCTLNVMNGIEKLVINLGEVQQRSFRGKLCVI